MGSTPLILAVDNNRPAVITELARHDITDEDVSEVGVTALMLATVKEFTDVVELLLECGASKETVGLLGYKALDIAQAMELEGRIVELLE